MKPIHQQSASSVRSSGTPGRSSTGNDSGIIFGIILLFISFYGAEAQAIDTILFVENQYIYRLISEPADCAHCVIQTRVFKHTYYKGDSFQPIVFAGKGYYFSHWEFDDGFIIDYPHLMVTLENIAPNRWLKAVFKKIPKIGDIDGDNKIGLPEAIHALRIAAGFPE